MAGVMGGDGSEIGAATPALPAAGGAAVAEGEPELPGEAGEALACPLCAYDLRGQIEPRCPECGYRFAWEELRDPARRLHPYLFEHHPWWPAAFVRTVVGGLRPRRFWSTIQPTQPSRARWLVVYALVAIIMALLPAAAEFGVTVANLHGQNLSRRASFQAWLSTPPGKQELARAGLTASQWLDGFVPLFPDAKLLRQAAGNPPLSRQLIYATLPLAWAGTSGLAMMVFQISMRRARIRPTNVARCVVYSADVALWASLPLLFVAGWDVITFVGNPANFPAFSWQAMRDLERWLAAAAVAIFAYRFMIATRKYLRLEHALATMVATQVLAGLAVIVVLLQFRDFFLAVWFDWR
jgi:hypothetical protein